LHFDNFFAVCKGNGRAQKQKIGAGNPLIKFASTERLAAFDDWVSKKKGGGYGWT
tara:strand:- start:12 stop:176 length:165 start_codon:yes stop_codon:yes gene_type:complete